MNAKDIPPDDFLQYVAETAREVAKIGRRTEKAIEKMTAVVSALLQEQRMANEVLQTVASGINSVASGISSMASELSDFNAISFGSTLSATKDLMQFLEESRDDMKRLAELGDIMAAYLAPQPESGSETENTEDTEDDEGDEDTDDTEDDDPEQP